MKLFELSQMYNDTLDEVTDNDELSPQIIDDVMTGIEADFKEKGVAVASYFKNMEVDIKAIKEAEADMKERRLAMEKKVSSLKKYLLDNMIRTEITKIECPYFKISVRNNPISVQVLDESDIPDNFKITKQVTSIDKKSIKDAGGCPGVELVSGKSLQIK